MSCASCQGLCFSWRRRGRKQTTAWLLLLVLSVLWADAAHAQTTSVTAVVKDSSNAIYQNGTYTINFYDPGTSGKLPLLNGSVFQKVYAGSLDSFGSFSVTLPDNNVIASSSGATGTQWIFSFCANAGLFSAPGLPCFSYTATITGAPMDLTSAIQAVAATLPLTNLLQFLSRNNVFTGAPAITVSNAGVFTNTQMNEYNQTLINGCSLLTEFQNVQGANFATEGVTSCVKVPLGATVLQSNAVAGYVNNGSTTSNAIAGYFAARASANGNIWGLNAIIGDGGFTPPNMQNEYDVLLSAGNLTSNVNGIALYAGFGATNHANANGVTVNLLAANTGQWGTAFFSADGAATNGLGLGALGTVANSNGQPFILRVRDSTNTLRTSTVLQGIATAAGINVNIGGGAGDVAFVSSGISNDTLAFKHARFGATCSTAATAGATCTSTFSWTTTFGNANYTPVCWGEGPTGSPILSLSAVPVAASITVQVQAATAIASSFAGVYCISPHD